MHRKRKANGSATVELVRGVSVMSSTPEKPPNIKKARIINEFSMC